MLWRMGFGSQLYFPETRIAADLHLERVEINKKSLRVNAPTAGLAGTFRAKRKESGSYAHRRNWAAQEHVATLLYRSFRLFGAFLHAVRDTLDALLGAVPRFTRCLLGAMIRLLGGFLGCLARVF